MMREADKAGRQKPEAGKSCGIVGLPFMSNGKSTKGADQGMTCSDQTCASDSSLQSHLEMVLTDTAP